MNEELQRLIEKEAKLASIVDAVDGLDEKLSSCLHYKDGDFDLIMFAQQILQRTARNLDRAKDRISTEIRSIEEDTETQECV